jgi:hypothetical protein
MKTKQQRNIDTLCGPECTTITKQVHKYQSAV